MNLKELITELQKYLDEHSDKDIVVRATLPFDEYGGTQDDDVYFDSKSVYLDGKVLVIDIR